MNVNENKRHAWIVGKRVKRRRKMSSIGYRREKWSDSSFVARIGKKRRVPPARRGGSKAQATSERERRAGRGEARGHREGLIFLIGRGRGTARWRVRAKNEPASSSFYRRPEWLSGYFSLPARYFCKIGFSCEKARDPDYLPPSASSSKRVSRGSSSKTAPLEYIFTCHFHVQSFSTIETSGPPCPVTCFLPPYTSNEKTDSTFKARLKKRGSSKLKRYPRTLEFFIENVTLYFLLSFFSFPSPQLPLSPSRVTCSPTILLNIYIFISISVSYN